MHKRTQNENAGHGYTFDHTYSRFLLQLLKCTVSYGARSINLTILHNLTERNNNSFCSHPRLLTHNLNYSFKNASHFI